MACDLDGSKIGSEAHQRINESPDRRISASAHQLIGAQVWLGAHVTDGVLPLQASVVEHSDQSRKTVTVCVLSVLGWDHLFERFRGLGPC